MHHRNGIARLVVLLGLAWWATLCSAHKPSDSYLSAAVHGRSIDVQWDIALRDLDNAIGLDANGDGAITWGELKAKHQEISAYVLARLAVRGDGSVCPVQIRDQLVDDHTDGGYSVLRAIVTCPNTIHRLGMEYRLFFDLDPQHRGLLRLDAGAAGTHTAIFSREAAVQEFDLGVAASRWSALLDYVREGVWHIWLGYDHILFLLSLLLPAVLNRHAGHWQPVKTFNTAFVDTAKIVTAFTLAHSLTLSLAALGYIALPSRLVESAIAASVVLAALNNLQPLVHGKRWLVAFGFGLVHGLGFANVLADLGLPQGLLVVGLLGFNLGVEVGQLAIVAVVLPCAYYARRADAYRRVVLHAGSAAIAVIASVWLAERSLNLKLFFMH